MLSINLYINSIKQFTFIILHIAIKCVVEKSYMINESTKKNIMYY